MALRAGLEISECSLLDRFLAKVWKTSSCWLWIGAKNPEGYGNFMLDGKTWKTHRLSYELFKGEIPPGILIRHSCDMPACVNPAHLLLGTNASNTQDSADRGRHQWARRTHCLRGHEYTPDNILWRTSGKKKPCRLCRTCHNERSNRNRRKNGH